MHFFPELKVLVVDDSEDIRESICEVLQIAGCEVLQSSNGVDAFKKILSDSEINLVISDIRMPGGGGIELMKKIHSLSGKSLRLILITGFSDLKPTDAKNYGVHSILAKPFSFDLLLETIEELCVKAQHASDKKNGEKEKQAYCQD